MFTSTCAMFQVYWFIDEFFGETCDMWEKLKRYRIQYRFDDRMTIDKRLFQLEYLWSVFDRETQLAQVTAELLDALVVPLDGVGCELRELVRDALRLRHLSGPTV